MNGEIRRQRYDVSTIEVRRKGPTGRWYVLELIRRNTARTVRDMRDFRKLVFRGDKRVSDGIFAATDSFGTKHRQGNPKKSCQQEAHSC